MLWIFPEYIGREAASNITVIHSRINNKQTQ